MFGVTTDKMCVLTNGILKPQKCNANPQLRAFACSLDIIQGQAQGIDYKISGNPGSRTAKFRYYLTRRGYESEFYNFTATVFEDAARNSKVLYEYWSMTTNGNKGSSGVDYSYTDSLTYSDGQVKLSAKRSVLIDVKNRLITEGTIS